jgi:glycyl-tRNA synthetase beta subunit|tara:strand:- start:1341 stop:1841 length:501 start_codon:yes stop_codon:yes gene_type:complete
MKFSRGKVSAFYGADVETRDSIRNDVLTERYVDLLDEKENLENLLNIAENEYDELLFDINKQLFNILEDIVPEVFTEIQNLREEEEGTKSIADRMREREMKVRQLENHREKMNKVRDSIEDARQKVRDAKDPMMKNKQMETLRKARQNLSKTMEKGRDLKKQERGN